MLVQCQAVFGSSSEDSNLARSVLQWFIVWLQLAIACFSNTVLEWETVFFYSDVTWDHGVQSPERGRTPSNSVWKYFTKKSISPVFQACHSLIFMYCSWNKYCLCYLLRCGMRTRIPESQEEINPFLLCLYNTIINLCFKFVTRLYVKYCWFNRYFLSSLWSEIMVSKSPGRNFTLKYFIYWITQCRFGFYLIFSLHPSCEVSTVFIVVESTQKWPQNKYPESQDTEINKKFCPCC